MRVRATSCRRKSAGVANRLRARSPPEIRDVKTRNFCHRCIWQALEKEERRTLELLVRRLAAGGQLESADVREGLCAHGLEGAFRVGVRFKDPCWKPY
jgi:hypothetical protein